MIHTMRIYCFDGMATVTGCDAGGDADGNANLAAAALSMPRCRDDAHTVIATLVSMPMTHMIVLPR